MCVCCYECCCMLLFNVKIFGCVVMGCVAGYMRYSSQFTTASLIVGGALFKVQRIIISATPIIAAFILLGKVCVFWIMFYRIFVLIIPNTVAHVFNVVSQYDICSVGLVVFGDDSTLFFNSLTNTVITLFSGHHQHNKCMHSFILMCIYSRANSPSAI